MSPQPSAALASDLVADAFQRLYGYAPSGMWSAPGRVNLIGEHTDYNNGFVLPFALPQRVVVAAADRSDERWRAHSIRSGESREFGIDDLRPGMSGWQAYLAGVVWALRESGYALRGADLVLGSDVPVGAGLSSSAALECSTLAAMVDLNHISLGGMDRAKLARRAENEFVGAPTGLMDQAASTLCTEGHALFLDCLSLDVEQVPLDLTGLDLLVLDTNTPHALVDSEYAARRATCEEVASMLMVDSLRDVDDLDSALSWLDGPDDEIRRRRLRHVVTENRRVLDAVTVLRQGRVRDLAPLLDASHASMRDDFEITVPTVDLAVDTAKSAGALGARMTGGGFGGCIIALTEAGGAESVAAAVAAAFDRAGYAAPSHFTAVPSSGAGRIR